MNVPDIPSADIPFLSEIAFRSVEFHHYLPGISLLGKPASEYRAFSLPQAASSFSFLLPFRQQG